MANTDITVRDRRASNAAGPFEIYSPNIASGTRIGETSYTSAQMRSGIVLSVPDTTTSIEVRSLGVRCGQNKILAVDIPIIADIVEVEVPPGETSSDPSVVIYGQRRVDLNTSVQLRAEVYDADTPLANQTFLWSTGETTQTITVSSAVATTITYSVTVTDPEGNSGSDSHSVEFADLSDSDVVVETNPPTITSLGATQQRGGQFRIDWGDSSAASANLRISIASLYPPSRGFSATINEATNINDTQYTFTINPGDSVPNSYNLQVTVTVESNTGSDQESTTLQYIIAAPELPDEDDLRDAPADTTTDCDRSPFDKYISTSRGLPAHFCGRELSDQLFAARTGIKVRNSNPVPDFPVCRDGVTFNGQNFYYLVSDTATSRITSHGALFWQINDIGEVTDAGTLDCSRAGGNNPEDGGAGDVAQHF